MYKTSIKPAVFLASITLCFVSAAHAQFSGTFGSKMDVTLNRKSPPRVYIMGTAIGVRVTSLARGGSIHSQQLASMLESELLSNDNRLKPEPNNPETIISCEITRLESGEAWEQKRATERRKVGERQEWNDKKKKYDTKTIYQDVEVTRNYKVVSGAINISYQVKDVKTGVVLDSDTLPFTYLQPFLDGNGAPASSDVENGLIRRVVSAIIPRLTPTIEPVKVLLAQKDLKDISKLGEARLWAKMVEALEMMQPLKDPKKDAYRLYNLGVGYEAQAYQAEDMANAKKFLDKASALYNQAIEMKPDEKYFREPQARIEQAIIQYRKLDDQMAAYARAKALKEQELAAPKILRRREDSGDQGSKSLGKDGDQKETKRLQTSEIFTNQHIIDLVGKGLDEENLVAAIKQAKSVQFDLGPEGLGNLLQNKVSNRVIAAMRTRQRTPQSTSRRPVTKKS
jgi:hypothetical protein